MYEEAMTTLDWYGKHHPRENAWCPRCGCQMDGPTSRHALSRRAGIMICDEDGMREALEDAGIMERLPLMRWAAISGPEQGDGPWKG